MQHLMRSTTLADSTSASGTRAHARATHPAGTARAATPLRVVGAPLVSSDEATPPATDTPLLVTVGAALLDGEDGSLVTEYGLLAVVAATIAGVVMTWASGGALVTLFNALLRQARSLVGA